MKDHETVEVEVTVIRNSGQAILVENDHCEEVWLPISAIENRDALDLSEGETVGIEITERLAEERDLSP